MNARDLDPVEALAGELRELSGRVELIRARLLEETATGDLRPHLAELVPASCKLAAMAGALAREVYAREVAARGEDAGDLCAL